MGRAHPTDATNFKKGHLSLKPGIPLKFELTD